MATNPAAAIVLAAGKSTRMKSERAKVLHEVCGRPMLAYVLDACREAGLARSVVVVGYDKEGVIEAFADCPDVRFVEQREQRGTGHAVQVACEALPDLHGDVVVVAGDMPLVRPEALRELMASRAAAGAAAAIATTVLDDPSGYGRILRDERGDFVAVVEDRDCNPAQRQIREVNPSYYCFDRAALSDALPHLRPDNAKQEYYLTDVLAVLRERGRSVVAETRVPAADATGINSRADVADVNRLMQRRIQLRHMEAGVSIAAAELTWIEEGARIGAQTQIHAFSFIGRGARIGDGCVIGPMALIARGQVVADGRCVSANAGPADALGAGAAGTLPSRRAVVSRGREGV